TVLLSTHVMQEVEATCTRLVIINRGKLVAEGSVAELAAGRETGSTYVVEIEGTGAAESLGGLPGVQVTATEPVDGRLRVRLAARGGEELRPQIFALARDRGWVLWELHRERASLEQVFRQLTADSASAGETIQ
ncbi:MAG TPA: hypothetical protein VF178_05790, partial [Gemmatimonadaceae bacterium]